jgi:hypothetical protein
MPARPQRPCEAPLVSESLAPARAGGERSTHRFGAPGMAVIRAILQPYHAARPCKLPQFQSALVSGRMAEPAIAKHDSVDSKAANHKLRFARMVRTLCESAISPADSAGGGRGRAESLHAVRPRLARAHAGSHRPNLPTAAESRLSLSLTRSISRTRYGAGRDRAACAASHCGRTGSAP